MTKLVLALAAIAVLATIVPFAACTPQAQTDCAAEYHADIDVVSADRVEVSVRVAADGLPDASSLPFAFPPVLFCNESTIPALKSDLSEAYPDGIDVAGITDLRLSGDVAAWEICGETLIVYPKNSVRSTRAGNFCFDYTLDLPRNAMRLGYDDFAIRLADILPRLCVFDGEITDFRYYSIGDPYAFDAADHYVDICFPPGFTVAVGGDVSATEGGVSVTLKNARDFTCVLLDDPEIATASDGDFCVTAYADDIAVARSAADLALSSSRYFDAKFGMRTRRTLSVVVLPFYGGGMEYCGLVYVSDSLSAAQTAASIVHEVAHGWWYDDVGFDQVRRPWQDEALAQASTFAYFADALPSFGAALLGTAVSNGKNGGDISRPLAEYSSQYDYYATVYCKAAAALYSLRGSLGDDAFFGSLRSLHDRYVGEAFTSQALSPIFADSKPTSA